MLVLLAATLISFGQDPADRSLDCAQASNTMEINECAGLDVQAEERRMATYLAAAVGALRDQAESPEQAEVAIAELQAGQAAWRTYADSACAAVYTRWQAGTIRVLMSLSCLERLTQQRSHTLWTEYLTYMDSTPPALPEPLPVSRPAED